MAGTAALGVGAVGSTVLVTAVVGGGGAVVAYSRIPRGYKMTRSLYRSLMEGADDGALPPPRPTDPPPPPGVSAPPIPGVKPTPKPPNSNLSGSVDPGTLNAFCLLNPNARNCKPKDECE